MSALLCLLIGCLAAASTWLMLSRNLVKFLFGLVLVSNVANLVIMVGGGMTPLSPALIDAASPGDAAVLSNALPQALVLTAIVIGFGLVAFVLVMALGTWRTFATVDVDDIRYAEPRDGTAADEGSPNGAADGQGGR